MILNMEISLVCFIYVLVVSEGTRQCSSPCLNDKCDDTTGVCNACTGDRYGYYCSQECTRCKDEQCDRLHCINGCESGYYQVHGQNYSDCFPCLPYCFSCQKPNECIKCKDGYFFQEDGDVHSCKKCNWNCATCSSLNGCISCEPGYYGNYCGQTCLITLPNCSLCIGNDAHDVTCTQCSNGTVLNDNKCETDMSHTCPSICKSCSTDNVCESCNDGWYGTRCTRACSDNIDHCVVCLDRNGVVACTTCHDKYELSNGICISETTQTVTSTFKTVGSTSSQSSFVSPTSTTVSASVQGNMEGFQTSTFMVGFVSGLGTCLCSLLPVGLICFLKRRERKKQDDQAIPLHGQGQPFYENSITADELRFKLVKSESQKQENIEQVNVRDDDNTYEDTRQTQTDGESSADIEIPSSSNGDQHDYTSLNIGQTEHVYRDLKSV